MVSARRPLHQTLPDLLTGNVFLYVVVASLLADQVLALRLVAFLLYLDPLQWSCVLLQGVFLQTEGVGPLAVVGVVRTYITPVV